MQNELSAWYSSKYTFLVSTTTDAACAPVATTPFRVAEWLFVGSDCSSVVIFWMKDLIDNVYYAIHRRTPTIPCWFPIPVSVSFPVFPDNEIPFVLFFWLNVQSFPEFYILRYFTNFP